MTIERRADVPVRPAMLAYAVGCLVLGLVALSLLVAHSSRPVGSASYTVAIVLVCVVVLGHWGRRDQRRHLEALPSVRAPEGSRARAAVGRGVVSAGLLALLYLALIAATRSSGIGITFGAPATLLLTFGLGSLVQARDLRAWEGRRASTVYIGARPSWWQWLRFLDHRRWVLVPAFLAPEAPRAADHA